MNRTSSLVVDAAERPIQTTVPGVTPVSMHYDTTGRLDRIRGYPVLVMAGEEDILIPVSLSKRLQEGIPGADWATSKGGHASMWEHPAEFNRTYLGWLGEHA